MNIIVIRTAPKVSGAEIYNLYLLTELKRVKNIKVTVLTNNKQFASLLRKQDITVHLDTIFLGEIGTKKELLRALLKIPFYIPYAIRMALKYVSKADKNIILMQSTTEKLFLTPFLHMSRAKIVWLEHGPVFITLRTRFIKYLYKCMSNYADSIITVSKDTRNDLLIGGISKKKVRALYIGLNTKEYRRGSILQNRLKLPYNSFVIGFVGTVGEEKGIMRFLEIAQRLLSHKKNFAFIVVGDGPKLHECKMRVIERKIGQYFHFVGHVDDVISYLECMDMVLLPTDHHEGLSLAILEAMAVGKIVYTHDIGGNRELIQDGITGLLYKTFDAKKMSEKILYIRSNKMILRKIQTNAQKYVQENFKRHKNSKIFYTLFQNL